MKDGGQAFPRSYAFMNPDAGKSELKSIEGMSLRDWFAGKALNGFGKDLLTGDDEEFWARTAYKFADAMLAEREKIRGKE